jgi:hypothetical protein
LKSERKSNAVLVEINVDENKSEKIYDQLTIDLEEINKYMHEFKEYSEHEINHSKLLTSFAKENSSLFLQAQVEGQSNLEKSLIEFSQLYDKFKKVRSLDCIIYFTLVCDLKVFCFI